jgi:hypothetical protein
MEIQFCLIVWLYFLLFLNFHSYFESVTMKGSFDPLMYSKLAALIGKYLH